MKKINNKIILDNLNEALKLLPGSIYLKDIKGVYLGCNKFQAEMAGFDSPSDIIGKTDYDLPWKNDADVITANDKKIMRNGIAEELIEKAILFDNTEIIMQSIKAPLCDNYGKVIGIVGVSLDITARKQAEERELKALAELAASETKRKMAEEEVKRAVMVLAGSIAHDLRTPLFCLRSDNHMLENCLPILLKYYHAAKEAGLEIGIEPTRNVVKWIEEQLPNLPHNNEQIIAGMHTFIDDNLKAIKVSTSGGLLKEDLVECKSYKEIDNALKSYPFKEGEKELIQYDRTYYFNFMGNPILFMRIIFNLLNNSFYQINKNGKGEIFISSEEHPEFNIIRFKDTGGGASNEIAGHIFEGYKTTKEQGTGVGLAFCNLTMRSFGGDMTCHSVDGDYIEFVLTFPKIENIQA